MTFKIIVACASFISDGLIAHDNQLLKCVAARLVGEGQVELELRTAAPKEQYEVPNDQPHRLATS